MIQNIGKIDRSIRFTAGLLIIGLGLFYSSWWGVVGVVPLLTAGVGWCPPYALLGFSTCKTAEEKE